MSALSPPDFTGGFNFKGFLARHFDMNDGMMGIDPHSTERAAKAGWAKETYNRRVAECRQAAEILADLLGVPSGRGLYRRLIGQISEEDVLFAAGRALDDVLHKRLRHVVTEAQRVVRAHEAMLENSGSQFGELMIESHFSLRDDYEVSCETLDALVEICLDAGALGARLTGAGMGGCAVALCDGSSVQRVLSVLDEQFYSSRSSTGRAEDRLFVAVPSRGASVTPLQ